MIKSTNEKGAPSESDKTDPSALSDNKATQKKQWILLFAGCLAAVLVGVFILPKDKLTIKAKPHAVPEFNNSVQDIPAHDFWLSHAEDELKSGQAKVSHLDQELSEVKAAHAVELDQQNATIETLKARLELMESAAKARVHESLENEPVSQTPEPPVLPQLNSVYVSNKSPKVARTAKTYVPAGSFVEAVLLSGVDASASVMSNSDPRPVLIRVTGKGSLPNGMFSRLQDCRVTGAAFADISSERVYVRLERMSCLQFGEYRDFPVKGYVSGRDGKTGMRGRVVMRDGALMGRAFAGGFVGGLSKSAANSLTFQSVSPEGSVSTVKSGNALGYAGAEGVSDSLSMYAKYQIKRAEQYQPVIEVGSNEPVDVVFTRGFFVDGYKSSDAGARAPNSANFNQPVQGVNVNPPIVVPTEESHR